MTVMPYAVGCEIFGGQAQAAGVKFGNCCEPGPPPDPAAQAAGAKFGNCREAGPPPDPAAQAAECQTWKLP